ncbi:PorT family protein [Mucilaginibacter sp. HMF5004]|uniref:porin family protein n=1 Tax=Mucilaginibacter rivuli TaxID=2857527 RepID=UPI001C5FB6D2|nr:porin family protein [Mucilaginibacter rivuli]MBW4891402.1 PorT family protein [Mucilaginibacter rivuli]
MKKIILLSICLLSIAASVSAQRYPPARRNYPQRRAPQQQQRKVVDNDFNRPRLGIVGGINLANIIKPNDPGFRTDIKAGLNAGISLDVPISYPFGFEADLLYSEKGYTAYTGFGGQFTQRSQFIDLPLLLKLYVTRGFSFVIGPQVSFLTSTQNIYNNGFTTTVQNQYNLDSEGYNKTLIDGVFGVAIALNRNVELRGRYTIDLQSNTSYASSNNPQYANQVWQIGIGYKF